MFSLLVLKKELFVEPFAGLEVIGVPSIRLVLMVIGKIDVYLAVVAQSVSIIGKDQDVGIVKEDQYVSIMFIDQVVVNVKVELFVDIINKDLYVSYVAEEVYVNMVTIGGNVEIVVMVYVNIIKVSIRANCAILLPISHLVSEHR